MKLAQKSCVARFYWGSECELLKDSYKDWQQLVQSVIFIYWFYLFLDCKILYLLR